jgi:hypothetical protein
VNSSKTYHIRLETRFIFSLEQFTPVDVGEKVVSLDFCRAVGTQAALWITVEKASEQVLGCAGDDIRAWESKRLLENFAVHLVGVLIVEWWESSQHFVEKHAESPPVNRFGISISEEKLGSEILRGATECYV